MQWKSYFDNTLKAHIKEKIDTDKFECDTKYIQYGYVTIYVKSKNCEDDDAPYIELSSRSLEKRQVSAGLYCYLKDYSKREQDIKVLRKNLENLTDSIFSKPTKRTNKPKKIASTKKIRYENYEDIVKLLIKCTEDYEIIMKDWR